MKFTMAQHREMLENQRASVARMEREFANHCELMEKARMRLKMYEQKFAKAEEMGKDGFDPERFLIAKKVAA